MEKQTIIDALKSVNASKGAYTVEKHNFSLADVKSAGFTFVNARTVKGSQICDVINPELGLRVTCTGDLMTATRLVIKIAPEEKTYEIIENGVKNTIKVEKDSQKVYLF